MTTIIFAVVSVGAVAFLVGFLVALSRDGRRGACRIERIVQAPRQASKVQEISTSHAYLYPEQSGSSGSQGSDRYTTVLEPVIVRERRA